MARWGPPEKTSIHYGVHWDKRRRVWKARYFQQWIEVNIGEFKCEHEAAIALAKAIIKRENETIKLASEHIELAVNKGKDAKGREEKGRRKTTEKPSKGSRGTSKSLRSSEAMA